MKRFVCVVLLGACGGQGSTDVQTSLFIHEPFIELRAGAPVAVGTTVTACAGSERTHASPVSGLIPGGSFNERSTSHPTEVTIEAEPSNRVRVGRHGDDRCVLLTTLSAGEIEVTFDGTIEGRESEASLSFQAVDAELEGEWEPTEEPILAGEEVTALVWAESSGTRVVTAAEGLDLPANARRELSDGMRIRVVVNAAPGVLAEFLGPRRVLERAESLSWRLADAAQGKEVVVDLHLGERVLSTGEHEVTIRTPERCTTQMEAGPTDAPETSTHLRTIPLRARENAPEGPCEMKIVTTYFQERYEQEASIEL